MTDMPNSSRVGPYINWASDMVLDLGKEIVEESKNSATPLPEIDFAMINVGGIRQPMPEGNITEGLILSTFQFSNKLNIISIKGKDIIDALKIAANKGGEGISRNVLVVSDNDNTLQHVILDGKEINPAQTYTVATIDYLAQGNDDLRSLANNKLLWESDKILSEVVLNYVKRLSSMGVAINPDSRPRFIKGSF